MLPYKVRSTGSNAHQEYQLFRNHLAEKAGVKIDELQANCKAVKEGHLFRTKRCQIQGKKMEKGGKRGEKAVGRRATAFLKGMLSLILPDRSVNELGHLTLAL